MSYQITHKGRVVALCAADLTLPEYTRQIIDMAQELAEKLDAVINQGGVFAKPVEGMSPCLLGDVEYHTVLVRGVIFYAHEDGDWYELCSGKSFSLDWDTELVQPVDLVLIAKGAP